MRQRRGLNLVLNQTRLQVLRSQPARCGHWLRACNFLYLSMWFCGADVTGDDTGDHHSFRFLHGMVWDPAKPRDPREGNFGKPKNPKDPEPYENGQPREPKNSIGLPPPHKEPG